MLKFLNSNPITRFLVEAYHEVLKVTWPTRQEVVKWLIVVIAVSLVMAAYVGVIDFLFTKILEYVVTQ
ncbi:MAG: preprotein translocase subunit SecE [bacterium]|nr:preprotein translocase subunit SecE [bacterium]